MRALNTEAVGSGMMGLVCPTVRKSVDTAVCPLEKQPLYRIQAIHSWTQTWS